MDGEFDGIALVAESGGETAGVALDALSECGGRWVEASEEALMVRGVGIVGCDADVGSDDEAAEVGGPWDFLLEDHAEAARQVVDGEESVAGGDTVDVAPAATVDGLEPGGEARVVKDGLPVERVLEVAEHAGIAGLLLRKQGCAGDGNAEALGEGVIEEFVVGGPPERIVDDGGTVEDGVLEEGAIEGDLMGDAVDDDAPLGRAVETGGALSDELGADIVVIAGVDGGDERAGEAVFGSEEDSDFFHRAGSSGGS